MARQPRVDYPGAWHHVMNRGGRHEPIFADDDDCRQMLDTLGEVAPKHGLEVHAYALMPNDYHLLIRSTQGRLSPGMREFGWKFTRRVNRRHDWNGPLFRGRFHNQLIHHEAHLRYLLAYVHLNPVRANLVMAPDAPCWTSHRAYLGLEAAPAWLDRSFFLDLLGGRKKLAAFVRGIHTGSQQWPDALDTETGWITADANESETPPAPHRVPRLDPDDAERLVRELTGASAKTLRTPKRGPRANPARRFAVWALATATDLSHAEVGLRLKMSKNQVSKVVTRMPHNNDETVAEWQDRWRERVDPVAKP